MPPPGYAPSPPPPPAPSQSSLKVVIAILVVLTLGGGVLAYVVRSDSSSGPPHPDAWDPRVLDIVRFDELHRGLQFKHPVFVDFLDPQAYSDRARKNENELSDEDKRQLQALGGELRALGLSNSNVDLLQALNDLNDSGTLAFYDPETERVSIRGTDMTPELRVTLAHELTHVLQDQHFGIKKKRFQSLDTSQARDDFRAVVEGDAVRIENEYVDSLSADEKTQYEQGHKSAVDNAVSGLSNVPKALQTLQSAPYSLGNPFVDLLMANGGQSVLDLAFDKPPATDEQLLDPRAFFRHEDPLKLDKPAMPDGVTKDQVLDDGDFGAVSLFIVLAERIDPFVALKAVDGWGGDSYLTYQQNGKTCTRINVQGDTPTDDDEMQAALDQWIQAMPAGAATESRQNGVVQLQTCDPGTDSGLVLNDRSGTALDIVSTRLQFMVQAVTDGKLSVDKAYKFGDCMVTAIGYDNFTTIESQGVSDDLKATIQGDAAVCRSQL